MKLTKAIHTDIPELVELLKTLFEQEAEFEPNSEAQRKAFSKIMLDPKIGIILVARDDEKILGMINLLFTESTALGSKVAILEDVVVLSKSRGEGIGSKLIDYAISEAKKEMYRDAYRKLRGLDTESAPEVVDTQYLAKAQARVWPYKYVRDAEKNVVIDKVAAEDGKTYDVKRKEYYAKAYSPKNPNLEEGHIALFGQQINGRTHSALVDVAGCLRVYMETAPQYRVDICAPENSTPSNVELCRIINPGPPFAHKVPRMMPLVKGKKGGRRTRRKKTQRKNKRRAFTKKR